jgi:hypothetical protein
VTKFEKRKISKNRAYRVLWAYNDGLIEDNYCILEEKGKRMKFQMVWKKKRKKENVDSRWRVF